MNLVTQLMAAVLFASSMVLTLPLSAQPTGSITGTVDPPGAVSAVTAVDRKSGKTFRGRCDATSGEFTIDGLSIGVDYDCIVDAGVVRLEGVNLKVPRSDYEVEQPLSAEDIETIKTKVRSMNKFEDVVGILAVEGNIQHAAVLLNNLRTRFFYASEPGEVVWRAELWHFERPEETWVKVQDELFVVLYRERIPRKVYDKKSITFDPRLGGLRLTAKRPKMDLGRVKLPAAVPGVRLRPGNN